jgi:hypothetical protein
VTAKPDLGRSGADAPSGFRPTDGAASVSTAGAASIPNAERLKLDRRIRNQRRALRENWMIVDQRLNGHRHFTLACIRELGRLCDLLGVPKRTADGMGYYALLYRAKLAASAIEAGTAAPVPGAAEGESATREARDAQ